MLPEGEEPVVAGLHRVREGIGVQLLWQFPPCFQPLLSLLASMIHFASSSGIFSEFCIGIFVLLIPLGSLKSAQINQALHVPVLSIFQEALQQPTASLFLLIFLIPVSYKILSEEIALRIRGWNLNYFSLLIWGTERKGQERVCFHGFIPKFL